MGILEDIAKGIKDALDESNKKALDTKDELQGVQEELIATQEKRIRDVQPRSEISAVEQAIDPRRDQPREITTTRYRSGDAVTDVTTEKLIPEPEFGAKYVKTPLERLRFSERILLKSGKQVLQAPRGLIEFGRGVVTDPIGTATGITKLPSQIYEDPTILAGMWAGGKIVGAVGSKIRGVKPKKATIQKSATKTDIQVIKKGLGETVSSGKSKIKIGIDKGTLRGEAKFRSKTVSESTVNRGLDIGSIRYEYIEPTIFGKRVSRVRTTPDIPFLSASRGVNINKLLTAMESRTFIKTHGVLKSTGLSKKLVSGEGFDISAQISAGITGKTIGIGRTTVWDNIQQSTKGYTSGLQQVVKPAMKTPRPITDVLSATSKSVTRNILKPKPFPSIPIPKVISKQRTSSITRPIIKQQTKIRRPKPRISRPQVTMIKTMQDQRSKQYSTQNIVQKQSQVQNQIQRNIQTQIQKQNQMQSQMQKQLQRQAIKQSSLSKSLAFKSLFKPPPLRGTHSTIPIIPKRLDIMSRKSIKKAITIKPFKYKYTPSIGGLFTKKSITKAPTGKFKGIGIRLPVRRKKTKKVKRKGKKKTTKRRKR